MPKPQLASVGSLPASDVSRERSRPTAHMDSMFSVGSLCTLGPSLRRDYGSGHMHV
jgi:hypothetical protein